MRPQNKNPTQPSQWERRGRKKAGREEHRASPPPTSQGNKSSQTTYLSKGPLLTRPATTGWMHPRQIQHPLNGMAVGQTHCDKAIETGHMCALEPKFPGRPWSNGACRGRPKAELRAGHARWPNMGKTTRVEDPACCPVGC